MKNRNKRTAIILGSSLCAAAWMIAGPGLLSRWGINGVANDMLVWFPAMAVFFAAVAGDKKTIACEVRAFKRLLGR